MHISVFPAGEGRVGGCVCVCVWADTANICLGHKICIKPKSMLDYSVSECVCECVCVCRAVKDWKIVINASW